MHDQSWSVAASSAMPMIVSAVGAISKAFELEKNKEGGQTKIMEKTYYGTDGKTPTHSEIIYSNDSGGDIVNALMKKEAISEMTQMAIEIYKYRPMDMPMPRTWEDVAMELVRNGPFMLAVGALWGVSKEGIKNAGDTINGDISHSNLAKEGSSISTEDNPSTILEGNTLGEGATLGNTPEPLETPEPLPPQE